MALKVAEIDEKYIVVSELDRAAIRFVEAVVTADKAHPEWSGLDTYLVDDEIPAWAKLKQEVRRAKRRG